MFPTIRLIKHLHFKWRSIRILKQQALRFILASIVNN
ncbi:hypothetical protein EMIT0373P_30161 [Pseudomonas chlororaphis]